MSLAVDQYKHHKSIANQQRSSFKEKTQNIAEDELAIVMDFKENIKLGGGPIEYGSDFYTRQQCSVFGAAVFFQDQVSKQPKVEYFDFFSDILSHDAFFVSGCLNRILLTFLDSSLGQSKIKKVHFWNDTGRHFQCGELAHFLLNFVPVEFNVQVTWNFFGEHHGKSVVDGHFGLLSRMLEDIEKQVHIDSIKTLIACLRKRFLEVSKIPSNNGGKVRFLFYDREEREKYINTLHIKNLCDFHFLESFVNKDKKVIIRAKVFEKSSNYIDNLNVIFKKIQDKRKTKRGSEKTEEARGKKINFGEKFFGVNVSSRYERQKKMIQSTIEESYQVR